MCIPSKSLCRVELRRPEVKIFRNSRFRPDRCNARLSAVPSPFLPSLVRKSPLRNYVRKKTVDSVLSLNAGFSSEIPPGPSLGVFYFWPKSTFSETAGHGPSEVRAAGPSRARLSAVPSAILLSLVRKSPLRNDVRKITDDSILSLNAGFSLEIPTGPSLEMFYFWPEIKIFRNGWVRAVRAVGRPVCHWDLCAKNPKNRFSL